MQDIGRLFVAPLGFFGLRQLVPQFNIVGRDLFAT